LWPPSLKQTTAGHKHLGFVGIRTVGELEQENTGRFDEFLEHKGWLAHQIWEEATL